MSSSFLQTYSNSAQINQISNKMRFSQRMKTIFPKVSASRLTAASHHLNKIQKFNFKCHQLKPMLSNSAIANSHFLFRTTINFFNFSCRKCLTSKNNWRQLKTLSNKCLILDLYPKIVLNSIHKPKILTKLLILTSKIICSHTVSLSRIKFYNSNSNTSLNFSSTTLKVGLLNLLLRIQEMFISRAIQNLSSI
jgi:hypothetical protein